MILNDGQLTLQPDEIPFNLEKGINEMIKLKDAIMKEYAPAVAKSYGFDEQTVLENMNMGDDTTSKRTRINSIRIVGSDGKETEYPIIKINNEKYVVDSSGLLFPIQYLTNSSRSSFDPMNNPIFQNGLDKPYKPCITMDTEPMKFLYLKVGDENVPKKRLEKEAPSFGNLKIKQVEFRATEQEFTWDKKPATFKSDTPNISFLRRDIYSMGNNIKGFLAVQSLLTHQAHSK